MPGSVAGEVTSAYQLSIEVPILRNWLRNPLLQQEPQGGSTGQRPPNGHDGHNQVQKAWRQMETCRAERSPALGIRAEEMSLVVIERRYEARLRRVSRAGVPKDCLGMTVQHSADSNSAPQIPFPSSLRRRRGKGRKGGGVGGARSCLLKDGASDVDLDQSPKVRAVSAASPRGAV